jgi:hypothetical protein
VEFRVDYIRQLTEPVLNMYRQQHIRLHKTVKFLQLIINPNYLVVKCEVNWKYLTIGNEKLNSLAVVALRRVIAEVKQRWSIIGWVNKNLLSLHYLRKAR